MDAGAATWPPTFDQTDRQRTQAIRSITAVVMSALLFAIFVMLYVSADPGYHYDAGLVGVILLLPVALVVFCGVAVALVSAVRRTRRGRSLSPSMDKIHVWHVEAAFDYKPLTSKNANDAASLCWPTPNSWIHDDRARINN
ncbi:hypothetical protein AAVH_21274 [Aphelenchoides avenae]|nr:hypothetical protein AAVH_21274 [Aphelenchus avenae]